MAAPRLTFFCELDPVQLDALFRDDLIETLQEMKACISLGLLDFSPERAAVVRRLNQAGIPLTAWLLLPEEQGYYSNLGNAPQTITRFHHFLEWTKNQDLRWQGIGLDIEPDLHDTQRVFDEKWRVLPDLASRVFNQKRLRRAKEEYSRLVAQANQAGYSVASYQFPLIADERKADSTLIQRLTGILDLRVDKEVLLLYSSFFRPNGAGILMSYGPEAEAVALGCTGRGVDAGIQDHRPLDWEELARDLRLAWSWNPDLYIFSLEGCVEKGYLEKLKNFTWDQPILLPEQAAERVDRFRSSMHSLLWLASHPVPILLAISGVVLFIRGVLRWRHRQ